MTKLRDGHPLPDVGFGLYKVPAQDTCAIALTAIEFGYRGLDTAAFYGNEVGVGQAVRECGVPRADIVVTTKLWNDRHGYDNALLAVNESLNRLGLDYIDLFLIHWPCPEQGKIVETYEALQKVRDDGLVRSIGVSNFRIEDLEQLPETPAVNQIELHPLLTQDELRSFHAVHGIVTEAWSPIARGRLNDDPVLLAIAAAHGRSVPQVILRWHLQLGHVVIPKSVTPSRIRENIELDFALTADDMTAISGLNRNERFGPVPSEVN